MKFDYNVFVNFLKSFCYLSEAVGQGCRRGSRLGGATEGMMAQCLLSVQYLGWALRLGVDCCSRSSPDCLLKFAVVGGVGRVWALRSHQVLLNIFLECGTASCPLP
jgi:hypothetical protein